MCVSQTTAVKGVTNKQTNANILLLEGSQIADGAVDAWPDIGGLYWRGRDATLEVDLTCCRKMMTMDRTLHLKTAETPATKNYVANVWVQGAKMGRRSPSTSPSHQRKRRKNRLRC